MAPFLSSKSCFGYGEEARVYRVELECVEEQLDLACEKGHER